jgi:hypothetical protein
VVEAWLQTCRTYGAYDYLFTFGLLQTFRLDEAQ